MIGLAELFFSVLLLLLAITAWWYGSMPRNLPPGPLGVPLFGSMFDTRSKYTLPSKLLNWTKIYGPIYKFYTAHKLVVILGDWRTYHEAVVNQADIYSRYHRMSVFPEEIRGNLEIPIPGMPLLVHLESSGLWREQRRFILTTLKDFGFGRGTSILETRIRRELHYAIDEICAYKGRPFDPESVLRTAFYNIVFGLYFGKRFDDDRQVHANLMEAVLSVMRERDASIVSPVNLSDRVAFVMGKIFPQRKKSVEKCALFVQMFKDEIVKAKRAVEARANDASFEPSNFVEAFYKTQMQQERESNADSFFTDENLLANTLLTTGAGFLTTAGTVRAALRYLAQYPDWQNKVYEEIQKQGSAVSYADRIRMPLTQATIMETQRLTNVTLGSVIITTAPSKIGGYDIPEGAMVTSVRAAIMLDPKVYPDPMKFDPTRFLVDKDGENSERFERLVPFGIGRRSCLGEPLARMELFVFVVGLIMKYKITFPPDQPIPVGDGIFHSPDVRPVPFELCMEPRQ